MPFFVPFRILSSFVFRVFCVPVVEPEKRFRCEKSCLVKKRPRPVKMTQLRLFRAVNLSFIYHSQPNGIPPSSGINFLSCFSTKKATRPHTLFQEFLHIFYVAFMELSIPSALIPTVQLEASCTRYGMRNPWCITNRKRTSPIATIDLSWPPHLHHHCFVGEPKSAERGKDVEEKNDINPVMQSIIIKDFDM